MASSVVTETTESSSSASRSSCCVSKPGWMNKRPKGGKNYQPTTVEDVANVITHGVFIVPCLWLGLELYNLSISNSQSFTAILYVGALILLLTFSTVHHLMSLIGRTGSCFGRVAHVGDRVAIFIFIAASYTPWLVLRKYGSLDPELVLYIVWAVVCVGLTIQIFFHDQYQNAEVMLYVAVGLGPSAVIVESICFNGWEELAFGGATYIFGVIFYKLDGILPFAHAVWHLFVIVGALTHYKAIYTNLYKDTHICNTARPFFFEYVGL